MSDAGVSKVLRKNFYTTETHIYDAARKPMKEQTPLSVTTQKPFILKALPGYTCHRWNQQCAFTF